jgi:hypothetical protein
MMNYNPPYYPEFATRLGFRKEVDFVSCYLSADKFKIEGASPSPKRAALRRAARDPFETKKELRLGARIGQAYNQAFVNNWEYYPLSDREIQFVLDNVLTFADPKLIKLIAHGERVVGFLFAFPDVSAAIQRSGGRLLPFGILDLLIEFKRTKWVAISSAGICPSSRAGQNALLYSEMEKTVQVQD